MSEENTVVNTDTSETDVNAPNPEETKVEVKDTTIEDLKAQIQNLTVTNAKLKRANDKLSSENGDLNKKYREKLSDEERRSLEIAENEAKRQEEYDAMAEQIKALNREKSIATLEKGYLAMGWTSDEANRMAIADSDNDLEARMSIMQEVNARQKKEYDVEVLKNRPPVNAGVGNNSGTITKEQFNKMSYKARNELFETNPELYNKLAH